MGKSLETTTARATKILLLGDNISKNKSLLEKLGEKHLVVVSNGEKPFKNNIEKHSYDLIVLELNEPVSEPLATLKTIKQQQPAQKVIVISDGHSVKVVAKAFNYGAADFFRTPVNISLLNERIDALVHTA